MHIAIVNLTSGGMSGGYRKYLQELVPRLRAHASVEALSVFNPPNFQDGAVERVAQAVSWSGGMNGLRRELRARCPDIVFFPTARSINCADLPTAIMVRNMEPLAAPFAENPLSVRARNLARRMAARRSCEQATRIIAVSRYVADFLSQKWRIPEERVGVVYHGVEQGTETERTAVPRPLVAHVNPKQPWVFSAGSIRPARGLSDLLLALRYLRDSGPLTVVIAGTPDRGVERHFSLLQRMANEQKRARVIWCGQLDSSAMRWCMQHASATLLTTRAEACPNIALEAMACGALVLAADNPPLPEFLGDTAQYYRARDPRDLARQLERALRTPESVRALTAARARECARRFTWESTVEQTVRELQMAVRREAVRVAAF